MAFLQNLDGEEMNKSIFYGALVLILMAFIPQKVQAQLGLGIESNYVMGLANNNYKIWDEIYTPDISNGYEIKAVGMYHLEKAHLDLILKAGYKQLFFSGKGQVNTYSGEINKLVGAIGGQYYFSSKFSVGLLLEMENNLDFEYYRTQTNDLLRYAIAAQLNYFITKDLSVFAAFSSAFYPIKNHYIIFNPQHQLRLGVHYKIF